MMLSTTATAAASSISTKEQKTEEIMLQEATRLKNRHVQTTNERKANLRL